MNKFKINKTKTDNFIKQCLTNPLLFDGAMGTQIQAQNPELSLFRGLEGFGEILNSTAPEIIENIHLNYLKNGARGIETNTFSANGIVMEEYGIARAEKIYEISKLGAEIAASAIKKFSQSHPGEYFVGGSIGPSSKLPTLGHIGFRAMAEAYKPQVEGLIDGGADILIIETCQDILQVKCLLTVISEIFAHKKEALPVIVSLTLQSNGAMLTGTDITAIAAILNDHDAVTAIGFNCALGPFELEKHIETLCRLTNKPVSAMPNAGLPENINGKTVYRLTPDEYAGYISRFVSKYGVNIAGGCCGTTPAHIHAASEALKSLKPAARFNQIEPSISSYYSAWSKKQEPRPFIIGERTNSNGSKAFRDLLIENDYDAMLSVARNQQNGGAHAIDLCVAYAGRDEINDIHEISKRFVTGVNLPLVIDSTNPKAIEAALMNHAGKCIINSINLEDGGSRLHEITSLAKKYNAALIALSIDERGMARTASEKLEIARRIYNICTNKYGIAPHDLIFDPLTFTIGSGDETLRDSAIETINAVKSIKNSLPGVYTSLGISNISFGLKSETRKIINSVFLKYCIDAGLDMAIINPAGFLPYYKIEKEDLSVTEALIFNRRENQKDPLLELIKHFDKKSGCSKKLSTQTAASDISNPPEFLTKLVIDGERNGLEDALERLSNELEPAAIINGPLIGAMKKVGELFGAGVMQLPFVLQSAEIMKRAVNLLETKIKKANYEKAGKIVLATVSGDVHDIGKNLVDIIFTNNGYEVYNIGIKISIEEMISACDKCGANIIGMSGLLVRSTEIMRSNLLELNRRGLKYDVILGGAALTRQFTEELSKIYSGRVFYAEDAFTGLEIMQKINKETVTRPQESAEKKYIDKTGINEKSNDIKTKISHLNSKPQNKISFQNHSQDAVNSTSSLNYDVPIPPFTGRRIIKNIDPALIYPLINKTILYRAQWQYKKGKLTDSEYNELINEIVEPLFLKICDKCVSENLFELSAVYGYYRCASANNAVKIFSTDNENEIIGTLQFPHPEKANERGITNFIIPENSGVKDIIGLFAVTAGKKIGLEIKKLYETGNYKDYLHLHGFSVTAAEALAEYIHILMCRELKIFKNNTTRSSAAFERERRGARYSFGYPACPDLNMQKILFKILDPGKIGIELTESLQMVPEQSVTAIVIHNPEAGYSNNSNF